MAKRKKNKVQLDHLGLKTDADQIIGYLVGNISKEKIGLDVSRKIDQVILCQALIINHKFAHKVIPAIKETLDVSESTAWRIYQLTNRVYGPLTQQTREMKKAIAEEMIRQDRELAIQWEDGRALTQSTKNYILLHKLDKEEAELPDFSDFEGHINIIAVLPEQVGVNPVSDEKLLKEKLKDYLVDDAEDIGYEEA